MEGVAEIAGFERYNAARGEIFANNGSDLFWYKWNGHEWEIIGSVIYDDFDDVYSYSYMPEGVSETIITEEERENIISKQSGLTVVCTQTLDNESYDRLIDRVESDLNSVDS